MIDVEEKLQATTAEEYRRLASLARAKREADQPTELVDVPSGAKWLMRRPDIQGYVLVGVYPQSFVNEALGAIKNEQEEGDTKKKTIDTKESVELLIFARDLTLSCLVSPKIGYGDDEILPSEIDPEDFKYAMRWCMTHGGVAAAGGLRNFREGQERPATGKPAGKKLRGKAIRGAASKRRGSSAGL